MTPPAQALDPSQDLSQRRVDSWGPKDGLPPRTIYAMTQTPDGYLWLGTGGGLVRFDGVSFRVYNSLNTPGFTRDGIDSLMTARNGDLWAGTDGSGYGKFVGGALHRFDDQGTEWSATHAMAEAADGTVWLGGEGRYRLSRIKQGTLRHIWKDELSNCTGLVTDAAGNAWATTDNNGNGLICETPKGTRRVYGQKDGLPTEALTALCRGPDGSLWIGTLDKGLCRFKNGRFTTFTVRDGLPSNGIQALYVDREGTLWVGTREGLAYRRGSRFLAFQKIDGLNDNDVHTIFEDREGDLWVAAGNGVTRFANTKLTPVTLRAPSGGVAKPNGMCQAADGSLWFATDSGLQHLWHGKVTSYTTRNGLRTDILRSVCVGPDGTVWLVDNASNFYRFSAGREILVARSVPGQLVAADREGVVDIAYGEVFRWTGKRFQQIPTFPDPKDKFIFSGFTDHSGVLWLASDSGLVEVCHDTTRVYHDGLAPKQKVLCVTEGDKGCLWVGTDHGLGRFQAGRFTLYGTQDGLPDDNLYQVAEDGSHTLWVGGNRGIFTVHVADLDAYDHHALPALPTTLYTDADGVRSFPTAFSATKTRGGNLWFMGDAGFTVVDPAHLYRNSLPPTVMIEQVTANRREIVHDGDGLPQSVVRVPPGSGSLEVHYTAPSFVAPEKVRFRYQLIGYDPGWIEAGTRRAAYYTNLPPGRYRFRVEACNNDGVWNAQTPTITVALEPHYYQTGWFYVLCGLIVALCGVGLYSLRTQRLRRQNRELEGRVAERTSALVQAVNKLQKMTVQLSWTNDQMEAQEEELRAQNEELVTTKALLEVQNQSLVSTNLRLEALATIDPLTELPNHRAMMGNLDKELDRAARGGHCCSLLFFDIDHFKALNDTFGHAAGDAALHEFARLVRHTIRATDMAGRWGGEEFVVLLPETDPAGALVAAEHVRASVATHMFSVAGGLRLTCSVGAAAYPTHGRQRDELLAVADDAMYAAKRLGRNQVRMAGEAAVQVLLTDRDASDSREETALSGTVQALAALAEARDSFMAGHSQTVAGWAIRLAEALEMPGAEARQIGLAARLHNIGIVALPDAILDKPGPLTREEWARVRQHPVIGAEVVGHVPALRALGPIIHAHHERWDGGGYPSGISGEAIPLGARILAVADAYVAITSPRSYRLARGRERAMKELRRGAGRQFDPAVVEAFLTVVSNSLSEGVETQDWEAFPLPIDLSAAGRGVL